MFCQILQLLAKSLYAYLKANLKLSFAQQGCLLPV